MRAIDHHAWSNRWSDRHPAEKLVPALGLLGVALVSPPLTTAPLVWVVAVFATVFGAGVPLRALLGMLAAPALFLLAGAPFLAVSLDFTGGFALRFSPEGAHLALAATLRALAAVSCLAFLALTTPVVDWAPLLRRTKVPAGVVELILLVYRLIFVFAERALTGRRAQAARLGYSRFGHGLRSLGLLAGGLFQRGLEQARRMEIGLTARSYTGELRVLRAEQPFSWGRLAFGLLGVGLVGVTGGLLARALP